MYNSQYYTCEQIDQRLLQGYLDDYNTENGTSLTKAQFLQMLSTVIGKSTTVDTLVAQLGYYVCSTDANVAAKEISATGYVLSVGGSMKVKMTNANTADNATLNINSIEAKALYYDGVRASANNSWEAGETVEVYYDGTSYYANNVKGGSGSGDGAFDVSAKYPTSGVEGGNTYTLAGALAVLNTNLSASKKKGGMSIKFIQSSDGKYVQARCMAQNFTTDVTKWQGVDITPTANSKNLVESGGVFDFIKINGNAYDISAANEDAQYTALTSTALNSIPISIRSGGMCVKLIISNYSIKKVTNATEIPSDAVNLDLGNIGKVATNSQLRNITGMVVSDIPTVKGQSKKFYTNYEAPYTVWTVTLESDSASEYVYYQSIDSTWSNDVNRWKNIETVFEEFDEPKIATVFRNFGLENLADFSQFTSSDVIYTSIQNYTCKFSNNTIISTTSLSGNGHFAIDMTKLNLDVEEDYLIFIDRGKNVGISNTISRITINRFSNQTPSGEIYSFINKDNYWFTPYKAKGNNCFMFYQAYNETTLGYRIFIYRISDIKNLINQVNQHDAKFGDVKFHSILFEEVFGILGENLADFSNYTDLDVIYQLNSNNIVASFLGNRIVVKQKINSNNNVCIGLNSMSLEDDVRYVMRVYPSTTTGIHSLKLVKNATSSSSGYLFSSFQLSDDSTYYLCDFVSENNLSLFFSQRNDTPIANLDVYIYKYVEYVTYKNLISSVDGFSSFFETKSRFNYAKNMTWELLDGSYENLSVAVDNVDKNKCVITNPDSGNRLAAFLLPQLPEGGNYVVTLKCSNLMYPPYIQNVTGGAYLNTFTSLGNGEYVSNWSNWNNYHEVYYPLVLDLYVNYQVTHNVELYITNSNEPLEKSVVKSTNIEGINQLNLSASFLERCDYLQDNPTLYRGMDIVAFNKGVCIGDSLTVGSLNTTDAQGNAGPNLQDLRGRDFMLARNYPAKLSRLTGIDLTMLGAGGKTSGYVYETFIENNENLGGNEFAIIQLGRNDIEQPPIGYGGWGQDSITAFTNIIRKLQEVNNGIKIFVCNDTSIVGNKEKTELVTGIEQFVAELNDPDVILLDMWKYGRLNMTNAYQCGHLSQYGYYRLAQDYCNYISWYMHTHKEEFRFIQFIGTNYIYTKNY